MLQDDDGRGTGTRGLAPDAGADLQAVVAIAALVHPDYPESDAVFTERLHLCPEGCFVLAQGDPILGYALSHPWRDLDPPPLDSLLGALPAEPDTWYIHDVAILPEGGAEERERRLFYAFRKPLVCIGRRTCRLSQSREATCSGPVKVSWRAPSSGRECCAATAKAQIT